MKRKYTFQEIISKYVPEATVRYCCELWLLYKFRFIVKKKRNTRLGDYSYDPTTARHTITVNGDQNPYAFLVTYLHEVAHLMCGVRYGFRVKPHGTEWKSCFKEIAYPLMKEEIFPPDVLEPLFDYISNPKATSCSDIDLLRALHQYDDQPLIFLSDLSDGDIFRLQNRFFKKGKTVRTRALCEEMGTGATFYVPLAAQVELVQKSMF
ncbi:MAG: SprT-like domain-containing protein [Cytophagaceae bacterium]|jgi:hypothetical protein|nr:SprT-like domain-containing protein [Cytophagaceae bacterium]